MASSQSPTENMEIAPERHPATTATNNNAASKDKSRPRSRASTTSLQSVGVGSAFQPPQQQDESIMDPSGFFIQQHGHHATPAIYGQNPEEMLLGYQQSMAQYPQQPHNFDPAAVSAGMPPQQDMRHMSQPPFQDLQHFPVQYPNGLPNYAMGQQHMHHMRHHSEQFEGSPAPEDSNNEGGAKRRKGTASSVANDQELRRLLAQYQNKSLKEVAAEVQKSEGSGGKSEKAKQVFAMLWLQESCTRSSNSVRRDRVFMRYTERCGNERVPTLNPASFGKLVRIIFPNVQTRRLGVRGESKYHYVDLSLIVDDDDRPFAPPLERPSTAGGISRDRADSTAGSNKAFKPLISPPLERPMSRATMETADFPAPSASFLSRGPDATEQDEQRPEPPTSERLDCKYINTPTVRFPVKNISSHIVGALPAVRPNLPGSMAAYLAMPKADSLEPQQTSPQDAPIELPAIHPYLEGTNYDAPIATALFHLYRSYCIDVIDAFRKCKEKPFFNHHSAFNGKMTVPVSKLFSMECLAPWIQECDMRMYKQIVKFIAPLALQNVPDVVWTTFDRIGARLVSHLVSAFEEKCPVHVVVAKTIPAARFANLLRKLKSANAATLQLNRMLEDSQQRTQMWLDLMAMVDPDQLLEESMPPPESLRAVQALLKHDMRSLIAPLDGDLVTAAETDPTSAYVLLLNDPDSFGLGLLGADASEENHLEKWNHWVESLPRLFVGHHPQCLVDWHTRFWRSIMTQMGQAGAHSYQSWWFVECYTTQMLGWMTQMEGLLMDEQEQRAADATEQRKSEEVAAHSHAAAALTSTSTTGSLKRKRDTAGVGGDDESETTGPRLPKKAEVAAKGSPALPPPRPSQEADDDDDDGDTDAELDELRRGGPLDLPSFHTGLSSPIKRAGGAAVGDDSGIDLGMDIDVEAEKEAKKFNKRDWLLSSDPADGAIGLGVVV